MSAVSSHEAQKDVAADSLILVIEDYVDLAESLKRLLRRMGYSVDSTFSGEQAIEYLSQYQPNLVILDLLLPGISGLEVLEWIRSQRDRRELPVMVYTTATESELLRQAVEAGATEVWLKGTMDFFEIVARVEAHIPRPMEMD